MRASPFYMLALGKESLLVGTLCDGEVLTTPLLEAPQPRVQALPILGKRALPASSLDTHMKLT